MSKFNEILNSSDASDALLGEQIDKKIDMGNYEYIETLFKNSAANTLEYTGVSVTIPAKTMIVISAYNSYSYSKPVKTLISDSLTVANERHVMAEGEAFASLAYYNFNDTPSNLYLWSSHQNADSNIVRLTYKYI